MSTIELIKILREKTGAGMLDCKNAILECNGDIEEAVKFLRKKGLSSVEKKSTRIASEGGVLALINGKQGVLVEMNSETDFVARSEMFQSFLSKVGDFLVNNSDVCTIQELAVSTINGVHFQDVLAEIISAIGENIVIRRFDRICVSDGIMVQYLHSQVCPNIGRIGVIVALRCSDANNPLLQELGNKLAMHIAAFNPLCVNICDVPLDQVEEEKSIILAKAGDRPKEILDKIVDGGLKKYFSTMVLYEQEFALETSIKITELIADYVARIGSDIVVERFIRYKLGDGIEKQIVDFAAEVAAQI